MMLNRVNHGSLGVGRHSTGSAGLIRGSMGLMGQARIRSWSPGFIGIGRESLVVESGLTRVHRAHWVDSEFIGLMPRFIEVHRVAYFSTAAI